MYQTQINRALLALFCCAVFYGCSNSGSGGSNNTSDDVGKSSDATLSAITINGIESLVTLFDTNGFLSFPVGHETTNSVVVAVPSNVNAKVSYNPSASLSLAVGSNELLILVTAEDGVTKKSYTVDIIRTKSSNAKLSGIETSEGVLEPGFSSDITDYVINVPFEKKSILMTATTIEGDAVVSYHPSNNLSLQVGANTLNLIVTPPSGIGSNEYRLTIRRAFPVGTVENTTNNHHYFISPNTMT
jgi:Lectin C-type domain